MTMQVALLRGINVGGHKPVPMADLRRFVSDLGFAEVRTLLQSGNLVFRSERLAGGELERTLEAAAREKLGLDTAFLVRSLEEWDAVIAANPFVDEARRDPSHVLVVALKDAPGPDAVRALQSAIKGPETAAVVGRQAYLVYPEGIGRSKLSSNAIESRLATRGTGRNWNTVLKLAALARS